MRKGLSTRKLAVTFTLGSQASTLPKVHIKDYNFSSVLYGLKVGSLTPNDEHISRITESSELR
jgi:hypothetical protein